MYRSAIEKLKEWKDSPKRKPLVVNGARQVGKTWLLKEFGRQCYEKTAYINMDNKPGMKELFSVYDTAEIIDGLKIEAGVNIEPGNTLVILDEIQEVPQAISALKYFNEEANEYHIAVAGSLLGVTLHEGVSFPVGKVDFLNLYPLNFKEFLQAVGKEEYAGAIERFDVRMLSVFADDIKRCLKRYYYIGGMPEVVNDFALSGDYTEVRKIQLNILKGYENDFSKHVPKNQLQKVTEVWNNFNAQLARENKKFMFGAIRPSARASEYEDAVNWLVSSGLLYRVNRVRDCKIPLGGYIDYSAFKLYFIDVGLLSAKNNMDVKTLLEGNRVFTEYKGALTEQFVLQELKANYDMELYYWNSASNRAEIDFLVQHEGNIVPVEVKAEENLQAKSLKSFVEKYGTKINVRTSMSNYRKEEKLINIPLYAVGDYEKGISL